MLASIIRSLASGEVSDIFGRFRRAAIVYVLAAVAAICGIGFLVAAGFVAAVHRFGAIPAAIYFGIGFIVIAILLVGIYAAVEARTRARRRKKARKAELSGVLGAAALAALPSLLRSRLGVLEVLAPFAAIAAYEVYKENRSRRPERTDREDDAA
jgi:formate hydrogenlyase subunit 3/multisubunit Na+/H+ antiporter MnhD subunit